MIEENKVNSTSILLKDRSKLVTHQKKNSSSNNNICGSASNSTYDCDTTVHNTKEYKDANIRHTLDAAENMAVSDSNFQRQKSLSSKPSQYLQDDRMESSTGCKVGDVRRMWDDRDKGVASEDNTSHSNNFQRKYSVPGKLPRYLQDNLEKVIGKNMENTGDDTSQTNHLKRKDGAPGKLKSHLIDAIGGVLTEQEKRGIGMPEKSKVSNEISFNDTSIKTSGTALSLPPPPLPLSKLFVAQKHTKSNTSNNIRIDTDTPIHIKICAKAGIPAIIEINVPVDTEIEIKTNPNILYIPSANKNITSYNNYTDPSESDSGYDVLSGSTSNSSCCTELEV